MTLERLDVFFTGVLGATDSTTKKRNVLIINNYAFIFMFLDHI
jgi:hypothetical protein